MVVRKRWWFYVLMGCCFCFFSPSLLRVELVVGQWFFPQFFSCLVRQLQAVCPQVLFDEFIAHRTDFLTFGGVFGRRSSVVWVCLSIVNKINQWPEKVGRNCLLMFVGGLMKLTWHMLTDSTFQLQNRCRVFSWSGPSLASFSLWASQDGILKKGQEH